MWPVDDISRLHDQRGTVEYRSGDLAGVNSQKMLKIDQNRISSFCAENIGVSQRYGGHATVNIFGTRATNPPFPGCDKDSWGWYPHTPGYKQKTILLNK